jgi:hypothetical protein
LILFRVIPFSNRYKDSHKYPLEYQFEASTSQTKLSTITPTNEWANKNKVNLWDNTYSIINPNSNKHSNTFHHSSSQKYINLNTVEGRNYKTEYRNNASQTNEKSSKTYIF